MSARTANLHRAPNPMYSRRLSDIRNNYFLGNVRRFFQVVFDILRHEITVSMLLEASTLCIKTPVVQILYILCLLLKVNLDNTYLLFILRGVRIKATLFKTIIEWNFYLNCVIFKTKV